MKICRFNATGECSKGASCTFSHDLAVAAPVICKYSNLGECKYGDTCMFRHEPLPGVAPLVPVQAASLPVPVAPIAVPPSRILQKAKGLTPRAPSLPSAPVQAAAAAAPTLPANATAPANTVAPGSASAPAPVALAPSLVCVSNSSGELISLKDVGAASGSLPSEGIEGEELHDPLSAAHLPPPKLANSAKVQTPLLPSGEPDPRSQSQFFDCRGKTALAALTEFCDKQKIKRPEFQFYAPETQHGSQIYRATVILCGMKWGWGESHSKVMSKHLAANETLKLLISSYNGTDCVIPGLEAAVHRTQTDRKKRLRSVVEPVSDVVGDLSDVRKNFDYGPVPEWSQWGDLLNTYCQCIGLRLPSFNFETQGCRTLAGKIKREYQCTAEIHIDKPVPSEMLDKIGGVFAVDPSEIAMLEEGFEPKVLKCTAQGTSKREARYKICAEFIAAILPKCSGLKDASEIIYNMTKNRKAWASAKRRERHANRQQNPTAEKRQKMMDQEVQPDITSVEGKGTLEEARSEDISKSLALTHAESDVGSYESTAPLMSVEENSDSKNDGPKKSLSADEEDLDYGEYMDFKDEQVEEENTDGRKDFNYGPVHEWFKWSGLLNSYCQMIGLRKPSFNFETKGLWGNEKHCTAEIHIDKPVPSEVLDKVGENANNSFDIAMLEEGFKPRILKYTAQGTSKKDAQHKVCAQFMAAVLPRCSGLKEACEIINNMLKNNRAFMRAKKRKPSKQAAKN